MNFLDRYLIRFRVNRPLTGTELYTAGQLVATLCMQSKANPKHAYLHYRYRISDNTLVLTVGLVNPEDGHTMILDLHEERRARFIAVLRMAFNSTVHAAVGVLPERMRLVYAIHP